MKSHKELDQLRIRSICAGMGTSWEPAYYTHWQAVHEAAAKRRSAVSVAFTDIDTILLNKDLTADARRRMAHERAAEFIAKFNEQSTTSLETARASVARQMQKWNEKVSAIVIPAGNVVEATLHGEIRRHVAGLKDVERMSFLEKNGADPTVASALLEAPRFLSGCNDAEIAMVKAKIEATCLAPEIIEAKTKVECALAELERAPKAVVSMIRERAGLKVDELDAVTNKAVPNFKTTPATKLAKMGKAPSKASSAAWAET
jgi:hypothetical protein